MKAIKEIFPLLSSPRKVVITTHQKPDADAMGSSLALYHFLTGFGHSVTVISPTNWAGWVDWMPGARLVLDYEKNRVKADAMTDKLKDLACTKILIDHHQEPDSTSFTFGISDTSKSSTCEMIYDFIVDSGNADKLTMEINECIYAGVVADTGSFRFSSTHAGVHKLAADLKARGLDHGKVHEKLFDNFLENRLRFTGNVLLNRMEVFYEYNTALVAIPKADLIKYQIKTGDSEGLVNFPLSIQGIKLVALVIDRDEERKWSFRSKGEFDCNTFARKYFEGGGHYNASGGRSSESLEEAVENFKKAMIENKNLLQ